MYRKRSSENLANVLSFERVIDTTSCRGHTRTHTESKRDTLSETLFYWYIHYTIVVRYFNMRDFSLCLIDVSEKKN